jgi:hypothetical protein
VRYPLRSHDIVFLVDIPEAMGSTLYEVLRRQFPAQGVCPRVDADLIDWLAGAPAEDILRYRLMRAQVGYEVYRHLPRKPVYVTMLRDPEQRVLSAYASFKLTSAAGLEEFLRSREAYPWIYNRQTFQLAARPATLDRQSSPTDDFDRMSESAVLEIAKYRLDEFAFFGLAERLPESLKVLYHTFDWKPDRSVPPAARMAESGDPHEVPPGARERIRELTRLDGELYRHAVKLFEEKLDQMGRERTWAWSWWSEEPIPFRAKVQALIADARYEYLTAWLPQLRKLRRRLIPEGSRLETYYLRLRMGIFKR